MIPHAVKIILTSLALLAAPLTHVSAAGKFSPVLRVNNALITGYQIEQRMRLMALLNVPATTEAKAKEELIDDRLKRQAAASIGVKIQPAQVSAGVERFGQQFNMSPEQVDAVLLQGGVDKEAFEHFIETDLMWRDVIRLRFGARSEVTQSEIDRAIAAQSGQANIEVTLAEIILPIDETQVEEMQLRAFELAKLTTIDAFSKAARKYSAAPTAVTGGKIDWIPLQNLPPQLQPALLALAPGEIAGPIEFPAAIGLFQLRGVREGTYQAPSARAIEYGRITAPAEKLETFAATIGQCDDLYTAAPALGLPDDALTIQTQNISEMPAALRDKLAHLDDGEWRVDPANDGQADLLMVCARVYQNDEDIPRDAVANALLERRLSNFASSYLAELRDAALVQAQ